MRTRLTAAASAAMVIVVAVSLALSVDAAEEPATQPAEQQTASRAHRDRLIAKARVAKARERMRKDSAKYSREQLAECENLYQVANKNWRTPEAATSLKVMIEKYPDARAIDNEITQERKSYPTRDQRFGRTSTRASAYYRCAVFPVYPVSDACDACEDFYPRSRLVTLSAAINSLSIFGHRCVTTGVLAG